MTEFNTHKKNMLALANDFLSRFHTPSIQEDPNLWKPALERVVLYIALAPYESTNAFCRSLLLFVEFP